MPRVTAVNNPTEHPSPDPAVQADVAAFFGKLFAGVEKPSFDEAHTGMAIAALNPGLAAQLAGISRFMVVEMPWSHRKDLREIAIQTINLHFKSAYSFRSRLATARSCGISDEQMAALPYWKNTKLFDDEQRLVIEYTDAVSSGEVPRPLFDRVVAAFGETGAVEFTALVSMWSFWALFLNATNPEGDEG